MASLEHQRTPPSEADLITGEKPTLTHTISSGAISISPELFEKVCVDYQSILNKLLEEHDHSCFQISR
jgi:hypothetical protein